MQPDKLRWCRFRPGQMYFCPPPSKRNTGDEAGERREAERIDKVRSALGETYNMELHFAIAHMRRLDGAYPDLPNGVKAADLLKKDKGPRCVRCASVNVLGSIHVTT